MALTRRQGHAIGGGDADRRRTAHHHRTDRVGGRCGIGAADEDLTAGQHALVEQVQLIIVPDDRRIGSDRDIQGDLVHIDSISR